MNPFLEKASICQWDNWAGLAEWFWWYGRQPKPPNCRLEEKMARSAISRQLSATTPFYLDQATFHIAGERQLNEWNQLLSTCSTSFSNKMKLTFAGASGPWRRCSRQVSCVSSSWPRCAGPSPSWRPPRRPRSHCGSGPPWETDNHSPTMYQKHYFWTKITSCLPVCPAGHLTAKGSPQGPGIKNIFQKGNLNIHKSPNKRWKLIFM